MEGNGLFVFAHWWLSKLGSYPPPPQRLGDGALSFLMISFLWDGTEVVEKDIAGL